MDLLKAGFWPLVALIFMLLCFLCFARPLLRLLEVKHRSAEDYRREHQLAIQERELALEEDKEALLRQRRLHQEQDALDKAKLQQETTEAEEKIKLIEATRQNRIDAEKAVIAAGIETRIALNNKALLSGEATANGLDAEMLKLLLDAYTDWCTSRNSSMPFGDWLGNFAHLIN
ncbi:MAG TPA: hypothetical protein VFZ58_04245 [Candidatus Saccharimonadales bacterium]